MSVQIMTALSNFQKLTCLVCVLTLPWTDTKAVVFAYALKDLFGWSEALSTLLLICEIIVIVFGLEIRESLVPFVSACCGLPPAPPTLRPNDMFHLNKFLMHVVIFTASSKRTYICHNQITNGARCRLDTCKQTRENSSTAVQRSTAPRDPVT